MPIDSSGIAVNDDDWLVRGAVGPMLRQDRSDVELALADDVDRACSRRALELVANPPHGDIVLDAAGLRRLTTSCFAS